MTLINGLPINHCDLIFTIPSNKSVCVNPEQTRTKRLNLFSIIYFKINYYYLDQENQTENN